MPSTLKFGNRQRFYKEIMHLVNCKVCDVPLRIKGDLKLNWKFYCYHHRKKVANLHAYYYRNRFFPIPYTLDMNDNPAALAGEDMEIKPVPNLTRMQDDITQVLRKDLTWKGPK